MHTKKKPHDHDSPQKTSSQKASAFFKKDVSSLLSSNNGASGDVLQVLLVAAPKKEVKRYEDLISRVGLELSALELEVFSLTRSLVGNDSGVFVLIDIGYRATNILLIDQGVVRISRNVDLGGSEFTDVISESLSVTADRAETYKKGSRDFLNAKESSVRFPALDMIISEVERVVATYKKKNPSISINNVILSGGAAHMTGLGPYLSKKLALEVTLGNPWSHIVYDRTLEPFVKNMGTAYSVALGLALRGFDH